MATEADKQNIGVITTIVAVGTFAMIAVSMAVTAMVRAEVRELGEERSSNADLETVKELKGEQRAGLEQAAHWADKGKGLVAIPLDRAMQLVTRDIQRNPHSATPVMPSQEQPDGGAPASETEPETAVPAEAQPSADGVQTPEKPSPSRPTTAPAAQGGSAGTAPAAPAPAVPTPTPPAGGGGAAASPQ